MCFIFKPFPSLIYFLEFILEGTFWHRLKQLSSVVSKLCAKKNVKGIPEKLKTKIQRKRDSERNFENI
jgi:hypothetical protein